MFSRLINRFYYGKSGKGDFRPEDLPHNRVQLFFEMLKIRFTDLIKLNLMTVIVFLPMIFVIATNVISFYQAVSLNGEMASIAGNADEAAARDLLLQSGKTTGQIDFYLAFDIVSFANSLIINSLIFIIPCILITGPVEAGIAYVTRNWARDEHAFLWADFKDAVKANWKQGLGVSAISSPLPLLLYFGWYFYGNMSKQSMLFVVPQVFVVIFAIVWSLASMYLYNLIITYKLSFKDVMKNAFILSVGYLPPSLLVRLLSLLPGLIALIMQFTPYGMIALIILALYYILFGFAFERFLFASLSVAAFDKFINPHIEGAPVNMGLSSSPQEDR